MLARRQKAVYTQEREKPGNEVALAGTSEWCEGEDWGTDFHREALLFYSYLRRLRSFSSWGYQKNCILLTSLNQFALCHSA